MRPRNRLNLCKIATWAAVAALFTFAAGVAPATEAEVAEAEAQVAQSKPQAPVETGSEGESNTGECLETKDGGMVEVNTLEDVFAVSSGNLAALMQQAPDRAKQAGPAAEEVRWQKVDTGAKKDDPERKSEGD